MIRVSEEFKRFLDAEKRKIAELKNIDARLITYPYLTSKLAEKLNNERNGLLKSIQTIKRAMRGIRNSRELLMLEGVLVVFNFIVYLINFVI
ncbi:MAG: hypothetical protein QW279_13945 [Candidatus Jordarchaeaceae archaeon]